MKATSLQNSHKESHLKVIKNSVKINKKAVKRIYINTLIPGFNYINNLGEIITPRKCVLL